MGASFPQRVFEFLGEQPFPADRGERDRADAVPGRAEGEEFDLNAAGTSLQFRLDPPGLLERQG